MVAVVLRRARGDGAVADGVEDDGRVEAEAVEGDVEREPGPGRAEQDLAVLPLAEVVAEVLPARLGDVESRGRGGCAVLDVGAGLEEGVDVGRSLLDVALDVHREARRLGEGEAEVECDRAGNGAETDDEAPDKVEVASVVDRVVQDLLLEGSERRDGDERSGELAPALRPEGRRHHCERDEEERQRLQGPCAGDLRRRDALRPRMRVAANSDVMVAERG